MRPGFQQHRRLPRELVKYFQVLRMPDARRTMDEANVGGTSRASSAPPRHSWRMRHSPLATITPPPASRHRVYAANPWRPSYNPALLTTSSTLGIHTMASTKPKKKTRLASGRKRARQGPKLNAANTSLRSKCRTAVKNVEKAVLAGDKTIKPPSCSPGPVRPRHHCRQGHLPQEQGRSRQKVKAWHWRLTLRQSRTGNLGCLPFVTRCAVSKAKIQGRFFVTVSGAGRPAVNASGATGKA